MAWAEMGTPGCTRQKRRFQPAFVTMLGEPWNNDLSSQFAIYK